VTLHVTSVTVLEEVVNPGRRHSKVEPQSNLFADKISDPGSNRRVCNLKNHGSLKDRNTLYVFFVEIT
jgi:hypothetical protein